MKEKKPIVAAFLGFCLGPFGALYFGWRIFIAMFTTILLTSLAVSFAMPYRIPHWYLYCGLIYFAGWNYYLALRINRGTENDEVFSLKTLKFSGMVTNYVIYMTTILGLYTGYRIYSEGRILAAVISIIVLIPLATVTITMVLGLAVGFLDVIFTKEAKT